VSTPTLPAARSRRLLYVVGQLGPGGRERQLWYLLRGLDRERYRPAVAVWRYRREEAFVPRIEALGVPVLPVAPLDSTRVARLRGLRALVRALRPEVLHCQSFFVNAPAALAALGSSAIAVGTVASNFDSDIQRAGRVIGRLCARFPGFQIFNNRAALETARARRSLFVARRVRLVRNGVDLAAFRASPASLDERAHVVGVGNLYRYKRWDRLMLAADLLRRRGLDCRFSVAGSGPERAALEALAARLDLGDRFRLLGHSDDVPALLDGACALAHTSDFEGCPNAVLEAMAAARAVVSSDVGDVPYLIDDGVEGYRVPRDDVEALADRLARLIGDRKLAREMGLRGRARAERELAIERLVAETLAAYREAGWRDEDAG
jgi:glycosyltransferase involved in cell wall biosynthesis